MATQTPTSPEKPPGGHEPIDLPIRSFVYLFIGFVLLAACLHFLLWGLFGFYYRQRPPMAISPLAATHPVPPAPQQQGSAIHPATPAEDLAAMRQREEQMLSTYGWTDRQAGIARIPIDRAMDLLLERGLPVRSTAPEVKQ